MQVGLLGALEVRSGGELVPLAGERVRALMARLALDAGREVPRGALIEAIWDEQPPGDAAHALQALVSRVRRARVERRATSIGIEMNAADLFEHVLASDLRPDVVTDQTSAHDLLNGYVPSHLTLADAAELRRTDPAEYVRRARETAPYERYAAAIAPHAPPPHSVSCCRMGSG